MASVSLKNPVNEEMTTTDTDGIVCEWLQRIGLGYAVNNFKTKGIDTPQALISLTFQDYDELQITALADRKRLFELVQRVRMAARAVKRNAGDLNEDASNNFFSRKKNIVTTTLEIEPAEFAFAEDLSGAVTKTYLKSNCTKVSEKGGKHSRRKSIPDATGKQFQGGNFCKSITQDMHAPSLPERPKTAEAKLYAKNHNTINDLPSATKLRRSLDSTNGVKNSTKSNNRRNSSGFMNERSRTPQDTKVASTVNATQSNKVPDRNSTSNLYLQPQIQLAKLDTASKIRVVVRKRPMSRKELLRGDVDVIEIQNRELVLHEPKVKVDMTRYVESHSFAFDETFDETAGNEDIYTRTCKPLVSAVFNGAKATCFAYGQTGSGKTYTMMGPEADGRQRAKHTPGLYELAVKDMFEKINKPNFKHFQICVSFFEIYGGKLFDLLNERKKLRCLEDGKKHANIVGLRKVTIGQVKDLFKLMERGHDARSTGKTGANLDSSRSHAVLQIILKDSRTGKGRGKISFIDLAGSERGQDTTHADRQTRMEGAEINKSLLALKECIRALYHEQEHTPFRGSKLTQVLKDSFTGNGRTVMVVTISPNMGNCEHTLNTLRYGYRVKEIGKDSNYSRRASGSSLDLNRDLNGNVSNVSDVAGSKIRQRLLNLDHSKSAEFEGTPSTKWSNYGGGARVKVGNIARRQNATKPKLKARADRISAISSSEFSLVDASKVPVTDRFFVERPRQKQMIKNMNLLKSFKNTEEHAKVTSKFSQENVDDSISNDAQKSISKSSAKFPADSEEESCHKPQYLLSGTKKDKVDSVVELDLSQEHQELVSTILSEEENLVASHREHIHSMMNLVKEEMAILNRVDMPGAKIDEYVGELGVVLGQKLEEVTKLKHRLETFKLHLREEETLHSSMSSTSSPRQ